MKIRELSLFCLDLNAEKAFYNNTLGFPITNESANSFTIKIGWSKLSFIKSSIQHKYHYCFLIPSNKLNEAFNWLEKKTKILEIEANKKIQHFQSWNAYSFYFYDANGNIAEFIVRKDLKNDTKDSFSINDVLCVNEIGIPTTNIQKYNDLLVEKMNSPFWKGNTISFGTNGSQEGLFLLPNYKKRSKWFPTDISIKPSPFNALIENNNFFYKMNFLNESLIIKKND